MESKGIGVLADSARRGVNTFAFAYRLAVFAHNRPIVYPTQRLEVDYTTSDTDVLEVHKIVAYPAALVRAVDLGLALCQSDFCLVGTIDRAAAQYDLPTCGYAASGVHDIVIAIAFVALRTLASRVVAVAVEDDTALGLSTEAVCGKLAHTQGTFEPCAAASEGVGKVDAAVLVPQGASVNHTFAGLDKDRFFPLEGELGNSAVGLLATYAIDTAVGVAVIDIEAALVETDTRCPDTATVLGGVGMLRARYCIGKGSVDKAPVDKVLGVEDLKTRGADKRGGGKVKILAYLADVGVGVVVREDGIDKIGGFADSRYAKEKQSEKDFFHLNRCI